MKYMVVFKLWSRYRSTKKTEVVSYLSTVCERKNKEIGENLIIF